MTREMTERVADDGGSEGLAGLQTDAADARYRQVSPAPEGRTVSSLADERGRRAGGRRAQSLMIVTPIKSEPGAADALRAVLKRIDETECRAEPSQCPLPGVKGIHVVRWTVLPRSVRNSGLVVPETLVLWTMFDGSERDHLRAMAWNARARLDEVYQHCEGYVPGMSSDGVVSYLDRYAQRRGWSASFDGTVGRSVEQIVAEANLQKELHAILNGEDWTDKSPSHAYLAAKERLRAKPEFAWAFEPPAPAPRLWSLPWWFAAAGVAAFAALCFALGFVGALVASAAVIGFALLAVVGWMMLLYRNEKRDALNYVPPAPGWLRKFDDEIKKRENEAPGVNRLTILTDLHLGFVRAVTMRVVLWIVGVRAGRTLDGRLQGIETIHFAQWRLVDKGRRLLFVSNFDGQARDYFRDFSVNAAPGVNALWSNTAGFPPTFLLVNEGSRNLGPFQDAARSYQIPTDVWYLGYDVPDEKDRRLLTTKHINDNTYIRKGLSQALTPTAVEKWLAMVFADAA